MVVSAAKTKTSGARLRGTSTTGRGGRLAGRGGRAGSIVVAIESGRGRLGSARTAASVGRARLRCGVRATSSRTTTRTTTMKTKVGFIGLGIMGKAMALNLVKADYDVVVYNRTQAKCDELVAAGATSAATPAQVVSECATTVCMLSDPKACLEVALGENGIASAVGEGKSIVDMSTVDAATSAKISAEIKAKGWRFLEAPVSGSKKPAEDGQLVILGAGDEDVYNEALPIFDVLGKKSVYLGEIGNGAKMKLVVNMMLGVMTTTFSEAIGLAEKSGLKREEFFDVLGSGALQSPWYTIKGNAVNKELYQPEDVTFQMKHAQKDLRLALALGEEVNQSLTVAREANALFLEAMAQGLEDCDLIAVHPVIGKKAPK